MDTVTDIVKRGAAGWGMALSDSQLNAFAHYAELLTEWNATRFNLTRLTSPEDIAVKHFLDSLSLLTVVDIAEGAKLIDVGTGAGLPGLALALARPDMHVTLLDSTAKKLLFCRAVADALHLDVETVPARAEDAARLPAHAAQYDVAVARAVAPLDRLLPYLAPFVRPGGQLVMLKGPNVDEELGAARPVARRLGVTLLPPVTVSLPDAGEPLTRRLVVGTLTRC